MKLFLIGMGPGMGLSIARRFGREGYEILMLARHPGKLAEFAALLEKEGIACRSYAANIADPAAFTQMLEMVVAEHPDIDILHYNASAYNPAPPSEVDLSIFKDDLQINVVGALQSVQAVFPQMAARKSGTIFLTGGGTALNPPADLASLGVGKAGMRNLVFSVAEECKPLGIRVGTITICGMIKAGTRIDPDQIAGKFWEMHQQPLQDMQTEFIWK